MNAKPLTPVERGGLSFDAYQRLADHIARTGKTAHVVSLKPFLAVLR